jgi:ubiquinone/menaquinone biosynthesis C-methylase UbiE
VGFFDDHVSPRIVDFACSTRGMRKWRRRALGGLSGRVVEIGFGSGRNLPFYPDTVTEIVAIEPPGLMRERAAERISDSSIPVHWGGLDGQRLDLEDRSFDAAVVTFSLCTIPDAPAALSELRRVVREGGELRLLEHGSAPDESVRRWQRRLNGLQRSLAGGCQLVKDPVALARAAGWKITSLVQGYEPGPKPLTYFTCLHAI